MANWNGSARSNYVKIKDIDGLKAAIAPFEVTIEEHGSNPLLGFCFLSTDEYGGWPGTVSIWRGDTADEEVEEEVTFDPVVQICPFMEPDQILVLLEAGAEKLRYITGVATAFSATGDIIQISLEDIYALAAKTFGVEQTGITRAEY